MTLMRNVIEQAAVLNSTKTFDVKLLDGTAKQQSGSYTLHDMEHGRIFDATEKAGWRIAGEGGATELLDLKRTTFQAKMKKLGIKRSDKQLPK
jgi:formate hydrogenlyase transcriptional activator